MSRWDEPNADDIDRRAELARRSQANTVPITAEIRNTTERGLALFQGARHEVMDERTGEIVERDHFVWLPKSKVTITREWRGKNGERMAEIDVPEWLAKKQGLI